MFVLINTNPLCREAAYLNHTINQTRNCANGESFYLMSATSMRACYCGRYIAYFASAGKLLKSASALFFKVGSFRNHLISFST